MYCSPDHCDSWFSKGISHRIYLVEDDAHTGHDQAEESHHQAGDPEQVLSRRMLGKIRLVDVICNLRQQARSAMKDHEAVVSIKGLQSASLATC